MRSAHCSFLSTILLKTIGYKCVPPWSLVAWPPCRLEEVWVECKGALNASRTLFDHEHNIKREGLPHCLLLSFLCTQHYADPSV